MDGRYSQGDYVKLRMKVGSYNGEIRTFPHDVAVSLLESGFAEEVELTEPDLPEEDVGLTESPSSPDSVTPEVEPLSPVTGEPDDIVTHSEPKPKVLGSTPMETDTEFSAPKPKKARKPRKKK